MVELFEITQKGVEMNLSMLVIPEFKKVRETYEKYMEAFSYIAFMTDTTSRNPYGNLEPEARQEILLRDFPGDYKVTDKVIADALLKAELLNDTVMNKYYRQVRTLVTKVGNWAETAVIDDSKDGNMALVLRTIKEVGAVFKDFNEAEKLKLEEDAKRKGKPLGLY